MSENRKGDFFDSHCTMWYIYGRNPLGEIVGTSSPNGLRPLPLQNESHRLSLYLSWYSDRLSFGLHSPQARVQLQYSTKFFSYFHNR